MPKIVTFGNISGAIVSFSSVMATNISLLIIDSSLTCKVTTLPDFGINAAAKSKNSSGYSIDLLMMLVNII